MIKPLKLTQEQKEKLLEMCRKLFPEYSIRTKLSQTGNILFGNGMDDRFTLRIHWFEFCMTHLPLRIFHEANAKGGYNLHIITRNLTQFEDFGRYYINPIDYLYKEFIKLKDDTKTA